jgi:macrolide transport system ATP-binding/permease protein
MSSIFDGGSGMKRLRALMMMLTGLFRGGRREREFADEIDSHLDMHIKDNLRAGMTAEQARRSAILSLGGVERTKQAYRERGTLPLVENVLRDLLFALRQLRKNPGFTATAVMMLALGLGASVSIFAFVDSALIKPLPYANPTRVMGVYEMTALCPHCNLSYPDYLDWKKASTVFSSFEGWAYSNYLMKTPDGTQPSPGVRTTDGFFRTLGVKPILGRDFYAGEDSPRAARSVLLSYAVWQQRFGGRPQVVGEPVTLNDEAYTIIGVLPREFHFAPRGRADFWTTFHDLTGCEQRRFCHGMYAVGRLKDGVAVKTANAEMVGIAARLEKEYPSSNSGQGAVVLPLSDAIVGSIRPLLLMLMSGAALLLLIACVNVSSLLLVRSESRKREIAVRGALGAAPARLAGQFVIEGLVLMTMGGVAGIALAYGAMHLLLRLIPTDMMATMPYLAGLGLNARVLTFAAVVSLLAAALFALIPTIRMRFVKMQEGLADGGRGSAGVVWRRLGTNLVVLELAIAVVLLSASGLLGKSFYRLLKVDVGFEPDHLATMLISSPAAGYAAAGKAVGLENEIVRRFGRLPGVQSVGISTNLPVECNCNTTSLRIPGHPWHGEQDEALARWVSADYFKTLKGSLASGRYFTDADDESKPTVVMVNKTFADRYFSGEDPVGRSVGNLDLTADGMKRVIGVVEDVREGPLDGEVRPAIYFAYNQSPDLSYEIAVRTSQDAETVLPMLSATIREIDPAIGISDVATMKGKIESSPAVYLHRSSSWLVGGFATVALVLSVVGLYGVIAYSVSQRTREIGVRMALGAQRGSVYRMILREAGCLIGAGVVVGLGCSVGAGMLMRTLLFGVRAWDASTLCAVAVVLGVFALMASYVPARRAASVNPVEALRAE